MAPTPKMKFYRVNVVGSSPTVVCERHFIEKLKGDKGQFVGVGLSCSFCREEGKIHKTLWKVIPR